VKLDVVSGVDLGILVFYIKAAKRMWFRVLFGYFSFLHKSG
jgi:hypothetical protein